jgi:flavin reductase (DIM6/NTAB) family NADH-FMN oxidoreductase RutF
VPAVLECRLFREVELEGSVHSLVVGKVLRVRIADEVPLIKRSLHVSGVALRPVAHLGGDLCWMLGEIAAVSRLGA